MEETVNLYPHQHAFLCSDAYVTALIGGIGSGKTWSGAHFVIQRIQENPETMGFIGANTVTQLQDATLKTLFDEFERFGIKYSYNRLSGMIELPQFSYRVGDAIRPAKIKAASLENFNALRGPEYGWAWLDETRDTKEEAFDVILGRLRCKRSKKILVKISTSPSGYNWLYDRLLGKNKLDDVVVIHAGTRDNLSLPKNYIKSLEKNYDAKFAQQELDGKFINLTAGKVYHAFDREIHVQEKKLYNLKPKAGVDFNIEKMSGIVAEIQGRHVHVYREYTDLENSYALAAHMDKDLHGNCDIVPDSTGKARKTSSKKTDHQILKDRGFDIVRCRNPFIEDRWNTVNRLLQEGYLTFSPDCVNLIEELERADLEHASKSEGKYYHITVALGYLCYKYFPLRVRSDRKSSVRIW